MNRVCRRFCLILMIGVMLEARAQSLQIVPSGPSDAAVALDLARYAGTWYEIAKYSNQHFQKDCARDVVAEYMPQSGGGIWVRNVCIRADGSVSEIIGQARRVGTATSPFFQVRFAPAWLAWLPSVWADYRVVALDADYRLMAISSARGEFLRIMSRTPQLDSTSYAALLKILVAKGYDVSRLERTLQTEQLPGNYY